MDLLILEEIYSSKEFRKLIYSKIGAIDEINFIGAWHSYHSFNSGESDIVIKLDKSGNKSVIILIENKIDAKFTKNQAERYNLRADLHVENEECNEAHVLLIAPSRYLENTEKFINTLSYEEIKQYFDNNEGVNTQRDKYKSMFVEYAIEKKRRGYSPVFDEHVTNFQHKYYNLSSEMFPDLGMRKPKEKIPSGSGFIYFSPKGIRKNISLVHKFITKGEYNFIDIQFNQQIEYMEAFERKYKNKLDSDLSIERANKSFVVRKRIDKINIHESFANQKNQLINSLEELNKLYMWLKINY